MRTLTRCRYPALALIGIALAVQLISCGRRSDPPPIDVSHSTYIKGPKSDKVIVFIHGIFGNATTTWGDTINGRSWPQFVAAEKGELEPYDVYVVSYYTPYIDWASTIEELSVSIEQQLIDSGVFKQHSQVYVVAHSMGGLIAKRILIGLNRPNPRAIDLLRRVRAIIFLSTPSQGASLAEYGASLSNNPQLKDMAPADFNSFLQILENQWQVLIKDRDELGASFPRTFCAYEKKPTKGAFVVGRVEASTYCDNTPFPIPVNHIQIDSPISPKHEPYPWAKSRIIEAAQMSVPRGDGLSPLTAAEREQVEEIKELGRKEEYHRAAAMLGTLVARYPNVHYLRFLCGSALSLLQRYPEAVPQLEQAKHIRPDHVPTRYHLAQAYFRTNRYEDAKREAQWVLERDSSHVDAMFLLAFMAYSRGEYGPAKRYYEKVISVDGDYVADAMISLASVELKEDQSVEVQGRVLSRIEGALHRLKTEGKDNDLTRLVEEVCNDTKDTDEPFHYLLGNKSLRGIVTQYRAKNPCQDNAKSMR